MTTKKKQLKVKFDITIERIDNIPKKAGGHSLHVEWKRGKKKENRGQTPSVLLPEGKTSLEFNHKFEMLCTLVYQDLKTKKFQEKNIYFTVVGEKIKDRKDARIGKLTVDLSAFAFPGSFAPRQIFKLSGKKAKEEKDKQKENKKKSEPTLTLVINSQWASKDSRSTTAKKSPSETKKDKGNKDKKRKEKSKKDGERSVKEVSGTTKTKSADSLKIEKEYTFESVDDREKSQTTKSGSGSGEGNDNSNDEDEKSTSEVETKSLDDNEHTETDVDQISEIDRTEDYLSDSDDEEPSKEKQSSFIASPQSQTELLKSSPSSNSLSNNSQTVTITKSETKSNSNIVDEKKNTQPSQESIKNIATTMLPAVSSSNSPTQSTQSPSSSLQTTPSPSLTSSPLSSSAVQTSAPSVTMVTTSTIDKVQQRNHSSASGSLFLDKSEPTVSFSSGSHTSQSNRNSSSSLLSSEISTSKYKLPDSLDSEFKQLQAKLEEAEKSPTGSQNVSILLASVSGATKFSNQNEKSEKPNKELEKNKENGGEKSDDHNVKVSDSKKGSGKKQTETEPISTDENQSQTGDDELSTKSDSKKERKKREKEEKKALKKMEKEKKQKEKEEKKKKEDSAASSTESSEKKHSKFSLKKDKQKKSELHEEIEKMKTEFDKKEQNYKEEISKLQLELATVKEQLQQERPQNQKLQQENVPWTNENKPKKEKSHEKDKIISILKEENRLLATKIEPLEKENKELKAEIEVLKLQLRQTDNDPLKGSKLSIATTLTAVANDNRKDDKVTKELRAELEELREVNESQTATIQRLENELKKVTRNKDKVPSTEEKVIQNIANLSKDQEMESYKDQLSTLQSRVELSRRLEEFIYGIQFKYDSNGRNVCALELSKFLQTNNYVVTEGITNTNGTKDADNAELERREFIQNLLKAVIRCYRRDRDDVNRLSGWLMWLATLYQSLAKHNKGKSLDIDTNGLRIPFETITQALVILHEKKDSNDHDHSIMPEKLLQNLRTKLHIKDDNLLDQLEILLCHVFILIVLRIRDTLEAIKFLDILFDQRQITRADNEVSSVAADAFEPKTVIVGEQPVLRLVRLLTLHHRALEDHHILKSIGKQIFSQIFYFMSASALNKMLTCVEFCRASRAYAMKMAYSHLEIWATRRDLFMPLREHFEMVLQACSLLMLDKSVCANEEIINTAFRKLNAKQIKQLLNSFQPDDLAPNPVPMSARMMVDKLAAKVTSEILHDVDILVISKSL